MQSDTTRHWPLLACCLLLATGWASAELQNVVFNGNYSLKDESRVAHVSPVVLDNSGNASGHIRMETSELIGHNSSFAYVQKVAIPARLTPKSYQNLARVFLSIYIGRPSGPSGDMDFAVTVSGHETTVPPYRVYTGLILEPGWHPILIDMGPWAGQVVNLSFQAAWLEGNAQDVILGLPRLVACHGPSYEGSGGLSSGPHYHGRGSIHRKGGCTVHVDGTVMEGGPLMLERFDVIKSATMHMQSELQDYTATLLPGFHWLPLQLPIQSECKVLTGCIEGVVEQGPIDVIPNFMIDDKARLESIVKNLDPELDIPLPPQLFKSVSVVPSSP